MRSRVSISFASIEVARRAVQLAIDAFIWQGPGSVRPYT
jgi:hypothetical protein